MSQLTKAAFDVLYNSSGSGSFLDNTSQAITASVMRQFAKDLEDSVLFLADSVSINYAKISVSSAEILALHTTPKTLVSAPGAGFAIDVISINILLNYNSIAYTTSADLFVTYMTSGADLHTTAIDFNQAFSAMTKMKFDDATTWNKTVRENTPISLICATANPTLGNSTFSVYITYRIITL